MIEYYKICEVILLEKYNIMIGESGVGGLGNPVCTTVLIYIGYTGEDGTVIKKRGRVLIPCSDEEYKNYRNFAKQYSIVQVLGKKIERDNSDSPDFEVEQVLNWSVKPTILEEEFLKKEKAPVQFFDETFGEFVLDKTVNWFEGKVVLKGKLIRVTLDEKEDISTLYEIGKDFDNFFNKASEYASKELLDLGNDWYYDSWEGEEEDFIPLTLETFQEKISLQSIGLTEDGKFNLWYSDGDIFLGHVICVDGNIADGFTSASMEG